MEKKKVALLFICLNPNYWPFLKDVITDSRDKFLKNHEVDIFTWSDIPEIDSPEHKQVLSNFPAHKEIPLALINNIKSSFATEFEKVQKGELMYYKTYETLLQDCFNDAGRLISKEVLEQAIQFLRTERNVTVFPTAPEVWPYPTLMRYHLFLQQEEILKNYDYIFYMDADMRIVGDVGDEILGEGLTMAEHPGYSVRKEYIPPYEPNPKSSAFIPRLGCIIPDEQTGRPWFKPLYAAGGFQGGKSDAFIQAMKDMRKTIDSDLNNNYISIWNDESHWNKYLYGYKGHIIVLTPSYVYPDSLINEYYNRLWGKEYAPKIVTLTKKFSTSRQAGQEMKGRMQTM